MNPLTRAVRSNLRMISGLTLLTFVTCHLIAHSFLLISVEQAEAVLDFLMAPWRTDIGTTILVTAFVAHYGNALWSLYIRRTLKMSRWEASQIAIGLTIPILLMTHVMTTRIGELFFDVNIYYSSILIIYWQMYPVLGVLQAVALLTVWSHAAIGIHFWFRTKLWYERWRPVFLVAGLLLPALALAGFVSGGNQILRDTGRTETFAQNSLADSNISDDTLDQIRRTTLLGLGLHLLLVSLPFAGRGVRRWLYHQTRPPMVIHSSGAVVPVLSGATVLETLRESGIPHASVCGGRARCTTCRILVTRGLEHLPAPGGLEKAALARIGAAPAVRLACQVCPTSDIAVLPLLPAHATMADATVIRGLEGNERLVTVMFVDLRGSTTLSESKLPYDVLFMLDQFFREMVGALRASHGHYSQFTGDGLMALYGLDGDDPKAGAADAVRGAHDMLERLGRLNERLKEDLPEPLRIGIGIHFAEAIVGALGPPDSRIITAIGDAVNVTARLEGLTKDFGCAIVISQAAAMAAGLELPADRLREATMRGRSQPMQVYALDGA